MPNSTRRQYLDIAFINFGKSGSGDDKSKSSRWLYVIIGVLFSIILIGIGYFICIETGLLPPPDPGCCFGVLELDFDFETSPADTPSS